MKKAIIIIAVIILILSTGKKEGVMIPKEAIRFRVIANSNTKEDQNLKKQITANIYEEFAKLNYTDKNLNSARTIIKNEVPIVENIVAQTLKERNLEKEYNVNYGLNYFPEKEYKGVVYPEGEYESLVVTLGDGLGENFWCVLFPPLCLLEAKEEDTSDVKYTSFIKEVLEKYF